ncbi:hypothetical protein Tco_1377435 [Tanacetum coccineum]
MEMQQVVLFYNRLDVPTRQILDSRVRSTETSDGLAAIQAQLNNLGREIKKRNNSNPSYQERRQSMEDTLIKFTSESTKRHEENSNLIKEIRAATDAAIRNQGASIKTLEIQIGQISKVLQERGFGSLPSSTETNPRDEVKSISTTIEADSYSIRRIGSSQYAVSIGQNNTLLYKSRQTMVPFLSRLDNHYCEEEEGNYELKFAKAYGASHINDTIPQKEKDPGSFTLPCYINNVCFDNALVNLGSNVDRTVKYLKGIAENVLVRIGKFTFHVDFIILDMPEDIKVPLILRRTYFCLTARAKIDVYKRKITLRVREEKIVFTSVKSASSLIKRVYIISLREIIELDLEARLMGETLVLNRSLDPFLEDCIELNDLNEPFELRRNQGDDLIPTIDEGEVIEEFRTRDEDLDTGIDDYPSYEFTHINFFPLLYVNVMSKKSHNSIMKDKMVYKGDNVVGTLMNVPIFVGTFSVVTDFAILENMDAYRNEEMGDVIVGEPCLVGVVLLVKDCRMINRTDKTKIARNGKTRIRERKSVQEPEAKVKKIIMEYLVKDSKRRAFWSLNEDILKITILKTNTPYPSRKIRRIRACTHQRPQRNEAQYARSCSQRDTNYISFHSISTSDIFTKPLDEPTFKRLIVELGDKTGGLDQISNKVATILYCLANGVQVDYAKIIWEDLIHKLNKKTREKIVPYPRFLSLILKHMMPEYENEELTIDPTQVFSVHNLTLKPNQPEEPPFTDVPVDSKAPKPSSQTEEVPQGKKPGAKNGLRRKQSSKHTSESKTEASKSKIGQSEKDT